MGRRGLRGGVGTPVLTSLFEGFNKSIQRVNRFNFLLTNNSILCLRLRFFFLDGSLIWYHGQGFDPESVLSSGERTVMALYAVSEEKNRWLRERMEALGIHEKDIEEKFIRSSGSGGQKVNKASTCVYLKHIPTGIEVKCMRERSQSLNRFLARRELVTRVEKQRGKPTVEKSIMEKARRQKSKRKKRARLKYGKDNGPTDPPPLLFPPGRETG